MHISGFHANQKNVFVLKIGRFLLSGRPTEGAAGLSTPHEDPYPPTRYVKKSLGAHSAAIAVVLS